MDQLPIHEKIAASLLAVMILFIITINIYLDDDDLPIVPFNPANHVQSFVEVSVTGAVAKPGVYQVKKGTAIEEVLALAKPLESADMRSVKKKSKIKRRRKIHLKVKM